MNNHTIENCSSPNVSSLSLSDLPDVVSISPIVYIFFVILLLIHAGLIVKLYLKHRDHLEPVHVLEISVLVDSLVWKIVGSFGLGILQYLFCGQSHFCFLSRFLELLFRFEVCH